MGWGFGLVGGLGIGMEIRLGRSFVGYLSRSLVGGEALLGGWVLFCGDRRDEKIVNRGLEVVFGGSYSCCRAAGSDCS